MRITIDLPKSQLLELEQYCQQKKVSRADGIRQAVTQFLKQADKQNDDAFGLWKDHPIDTDKFIDKIRSEWD